jgi:4-hydroxythreonine-4-phosphate dehydrogenase
LRLHQISEVKEAIGLFGTLDLINVDVDNLDFDKIKIGEVSPIAGKASVDYIKLAVKLCLEGKIDAMVTAPINKTAMHKAGFNYPGHTELLAELTKSPKVVMMLAGPKLKVTFVTSHVALSEVTNLLSIERIFDTIELTIKALKWMGIRGPKIAVAALNPHAGEAGAFGIEELEKINPAILRAKALGWGVDGPIPADSIFIQAQSGIWDAVVVMYHDQGNIPIKLLEFGNIVNVTLGLPIIRTSVDHGTAFDIAGKGIASDSSLCAAIKFAAEMCRRK